MESTQKSPELQDTIPFRKDIRCHPDLNYGQKIFAAEIEHLLSQQPRYYYSSRGLCSLFGISHQTVINWLKKLTEVGLVDIGVDYGHNPHRYYLTAKQKT